MTWLRGGVATDTGRTRQINQDTPFADDDLGLWAVADGMGGHKGGEVASAVAVEHLESAYRSGGDATLDNLLDATAAANTAVWDRADEDPDLHGMGTTLVAVARLSDEELAYVNVGDSRIYLLRDGLLERLTADHSLVEELVREGAITPEEAKTHPRRNVITRVLGMEPWVQADANTITPYTGDRYLLCSDGLHGELDDARIGSVLRRLADPAEAAAELVRLANEAGGRDNITVVVVDVVDDGGRAEAASALLRHSADDPAGFSAAVEPDDDEDDDGPAHAAKEPRAKAPRRVTLRVVGFLLLVLVVLAGAVAALGVYARATYFVQADGEQVVIAKGRDFLWFEQEVVDRPEVLVSDLAPAQRRDLGVGPVEFASLAEATAFIEDNLVPTTTTTTTTAPTTTTVPVATTAPTTAVP